MKSINGTTTEYTMSNNKLRPQIVLPIFTAKFWNTLFLAHAAHSFYVCFWADLYYWFGLICLATICKFWIRQTPRQGCSSWQLKRLQVVVPDLMGFACYKALQYERWGKKSGKLPIQFIPQYFIPVSHAVQKWYEVFDGSSVNGPPFTQYDKFVEHFEYSGWGLVDGTNDRSTLTS